MQHGHMSLARPCAVWCHAWALHASDRCVFPEVRACAPAPRVRVHAWVCACALACMGVCVRACISGRGCARMRVSACVVSAQVAHVCVPVSDSRLLDDAWAHRARLCSLRRALLPLVGTRGEGRLPHHMVNIDMFMNNL